MPALALVLNAFVWGVSWWPFRELQAHGLHPLWATALIYLVSLALLLACRPGAWRGFARPAAAVAADGRGGMTNVGFNWAVTVGDVVRVVLLFYLMPAWTVLLAWPLLGEQPTAGRAARLALAMAGVVDRAARPPDAPWPVPESAGGLAGACGRLQLRADQHPAAQAAARAGRAAHPGDVRRRRVDGGGGGPARHGAGHRAGAARAAAGLGRRGLALGLGFLAGNMALQYGASRLHAHTAALIMLSEVVFASVSSVALGAAEMSDAHLDGRRADPGGGGLVGLAGRGSAGAGPGAK